MRYLITYDLRQPGRDYSALYEALRGLGAARHLDSVWVVRRANTSVEALNDYLRRSLDANDLILVVRFDAVAGFCLGQIAA